MNDFLSSLKIAATGLHAQSARMRVIAENLANASSTPRTPEDEPYRRKLVTFKTVLDRETGVELVEIGRETVDRSEFSKRYDPGHPGADADGYVRMPNVNALIELMDMREAQRSYEANLNVIDASKRMLTRTINLLQA